MEGSRPASGPKAQSPVEVPEDDAVRVHSTSLSHTAEVSGEALG